MPKVRLGVSLHAYPLKSFAAHALRQRIRLREIVRRLAPPPPARYDQPATPAGSPPPRIAGDAMRPVALCLAAAVSLAFAPAPLPRRDRGPTATDDLARLQGDWT